MNQIVQRMLRRIAYVAPGGFSIRPYLHALRGVHIGKDVWISQYVYIDEIHPEAIFIGDNSTIGIGSLIISHMYWGPRGSGKAGKVIIESNVFIGPNCIILPHTHIGNGAVIQPGTTVSMNVPPAVLWGTAKAGPLASVSVPLTKNETVDSFIRGLKNVKKG